MIFEHLRELELDGLLVRLVEGPRATRYWLTAMGESPMPHLQGLATWSQTHHIGSRWATRRDRGLAASNG